MRGLLKDCSAGVLSIALAVSVTPGASFGLQAAFAADTPEETTSVVQEAESFDDDVSLLALAVDDVFEYEDIIYTVTAADGAYEVTVGHYIPDDSDPMNDTKTENAAGGAFEGGDLVIPANVQYEDTTYAVTAIDPCAFYKDQRITSLTIPSSIETIGEYAFYGCFNVATLTLNEGLQTIGDYALALGTTSSNTAVSGGQSTLEELTIPASVESIGNGGFAYLRYLASLIFTDTEEYPSQLTSIGSSAFAASPSSSLWYNKVLTEIHIPSSVTSILTNAFAYDEALQTIVFDCDTSAMKYQTSSSTSSATTGWFYKLSITDETAVVFKQGYAPKYWNTNIPTYMLMDFYPSEDDAVGGTDTLGQAAVAYDTSCAQMADNPAGVTVYDETTYGSVPDIPQGYTSWVYSDYGALLTVTAAGTVYPANVDTSDLQYATVTVVSGSGTDQTETAVPSSYDYDEFDADVLIGSLKVTDMLGNVLTSGTDYTVEIEREHAVGTATLIITGTGEYNGTYTRSIAIELSSFRASDEYGRTFIYEVIKQPTFEADGTVASNGTVRLGDGSNAAYTGSVASLTTLTVSSEVATSLAEDNYSFDVVEIGSDALSGFTSLRSLELPSSVKTISKRAFFGCSALSSLTFVEGLQTIGDYAFGSCTSLTEVTFPNSLTKLGSTVASDYVNGSFAFSGCTSLEKVVFGTLDGGGDATITTRVFYNCDELKEVELNNNVSTLSQSAFYEVSSLESITGMDNVTTISIAAFYGCRSLSKVGANEEGVLSLDHALTISPRAFNYCESLTTLRISAEVKMATNGFGMGSGNEGGYIFAYTGFTKIEFLGEWQTIQSALFAEMSNLQTVELPDSITSIESSAFIGCSSLTSVSLPKNLNSIGSSAFRECASLTDIDFPEEITSLELNSQVFAGCASLKEFTVPEGVTSLPSACFTGCTSLETVTLPTTVESIGESCFASTTTMQNFEEPRSASYDGCCDLRSINITENVTSISDSAFYGCTSLVETIDLSGLESVSTNTFRDCTKLETVTISDKLATVGSAAFQGCQALTTFAPASTTDTGMYLPSSVTSLGINSFYDCSALETVELSPAITSLFRGVFTNCTALSAVTIPEGVTTLGETCFAGCGALKEVTLPASLVEIGTGTFEECDRLADLGLNEGLEIIGPSAFADCTSLESVTLPSTIKSIAADAFFNCYDLEWIDFSVTDTSAIEISDDAFTTNNSDTYCIFVDQQAPTGFNPSNGHIIIIEVPETASYTGKAVTPIKVTCDGETADEDICEIVYADNVELGTATAEIYIESYYLSVTFEIVAGDTPGGTTPQPITSSMVSNIPTQYYTGKAIKPAVKVGSYKQGTDYTVTYSDNVNIGTAKATITPSSEIGGSPITKTFKITVKKGAAYTVGGIKYKITSAKTDGKGTVSLAKYKKAKNLTVSNKVRIGGVSFKVSSIGAKAFKGAKKLKNIKIGSSVKSIGKKAFCGCKKLSVVLFSGKKLPKLGKQAFAKTSSKVTVGVKGKPAKAEKKLRKAGLSKKAVVVRG